MSAEFILKIPNGFREAIELQLGQSYQIERVSGGLVHHVYRLHGNNGSIILKKRERECALLPGIKIEPDAIQHEKKAIQLLAKLHPDKFPHLVCFDSDNSMILMTDIMPSKYSLESALNKDSVNDDLSFHIGQNLASVHASLQFVGDSIRDDGDKTYYAENLYYRFGYQKNKVLDNVILELAKQDRQLIWGDPSPKNIGLERDSNITFCDLEAVHKGNVLFDIGFLAGHFILHNLKNRRGARELTFAFLDGYQDVSAASLQMPLLQRLVLGTVLCRLSNPVIPYNLRLTQQERYEKTASAFSLLSSDDVSWQKIFTCLTR